MTCSITVKYRTYARALVQPQDGPTNYDEIEQVHGPFEFVSKEMDGGYPVVYCYVDGEPKITFGPNKTGDPGVAGEPPMPRATLWVMNYYGATIAKYEL